jgi:SAC3 family protein LENG8/THP3
MEWIAAVRVVRHRAGCGANLNFPHVKWTELNLFVSQLTSEQKSWSEVKHALDVQRALAMGNYHALFKLYESAPNMGGYIMDQFVNRERVRALIAMSRA